MQKIFPLWRAKLRYYRVNKSLSLPSVNNRRINEKVARYLPRAFIPADWFKATCKEARVADSRSTTSPRDGFRLEPFTPTISRASDELT